MFLKVVVRILNPHPPNWLFECLNLVKVIELEFDRALNQIAYDIV